MPTFGQKHSYKVRLAISGAQRGNQNRKVKLGTFSRPIGQYTLDGTCVGFFPSATKAAKSVGGLSRHLGEVANGKRKTANGYVWKWWLSEPRTPHGVFRCRSVAQYTLDGRFVCEYPSLTHAAEAVSVKKGAICGAIARSGTAAGFMWKYTDER